MNQTILKIEKILTSEYESNGFTDLVREVFPSVRIIAPDHFNKEYTNFSSHIEGSYHVGSYVDPDGKTLIILAVQLKKASYVENSRSTQRSYAKKLMESGNADAAFIAFYTEGDPKWRLSYVRLDYEIKFENGKLSATESLTPAKRYSYLVGKDEPCHTAISRFQRFIDDDNPPIEPSLDEIEEAFSVEKVTEEFFDLYCEKFHQLREALENNPDFVVEAEQHNFTSAQFAKKLMGQIVFLYFLQKKGWLGVGTWSNTITKRQYNNVFYTSGVKGRLIKEYLPQIYIQTGEDEFKLKTSMLEIIPDDAEEVIANAFSGQRSWGSGSKRFMRTLFDFSQRKNANFFDDYLEPLFYNALNVNRGEKGYDPALHCRIPFLSGGLFEPIDGYDWKHNDFAIPNEIFSNKTEKGEREADGILDIFDRYNFTMSEDEPMEREVAIDPEMLGKVFENLLEVNERGDKGAFYTPREIVHYICQETLITYLVKETGIKESDIRDFILLGDFMKDEDTSKEKRQGNGGMYISEDIYKIDIDGKVVVDRLKDLDDALANIRVVDPAVGSGAFPLGMLNEIVRARQNISAYMAINMNGYEKRMMYNNERSPYSMKLQTIKDCLFASDIEPSAVDIAQLRLWLSLVIDDEINPNADSPLDGHRNPLPLPNLECNIICGNSLVDEFEGIKLINQSNMIATQNSGDQINWFQSTFETVLPKLLETQDALFRCENTLRKQELKETIEALKDEIVYTQFAQAAPEIKTKYQEAKKQASKPFVLWQIDFAKIFNEKGGFDVVIGNPPWGAKLSKSEKSILSKNYPEIDSSTPNSFAYFIGLGYRLAITSINLVLPDSILIKDYSRTRYLMRNNISEVLWYQNSGVPYDHRLFKSVDHDVCVIHVKKDSTEKSIHVVTNKWERGAFIKSEWTFGNNEIIYPQFDYSINLKIKREDLPILNKLIQNSPISSFAQCHEGIHTGNIRDKLFKKEYEPGYKPLYYGGGAGDIISTYYSKRVGWYVDYRSEIIDKSNNEYASLRDENIFILPKVYITRTGNPFKAFYDEECYASNNFFSMQMLDLTRNTEDNLLLILPFINSSVCRYFIRVFAAPRLGNTFIETKIIHLMKLPIPELTETQKATMLKKVREIIEVKKVDVSQDTSSLEKQINDLVYEFYNLTKEEIEIIEKNII